MKKNTTKYLCQRCHEKNQLIYGLPMGLLGRVHICEVCWVGLSFGLKRDIELFMGSKQNFLDSSKYSELINKALVAYQKK